MEYSTRHHCSQYFFLLAKWTEDGVKYTYAFTMECVETFLGVMNVKVTILLGNIHYLVDKSESKLNLAESKLNLE